MTEWMWILYSSGYLAFAILFLLAARTLFDFLTPYSVNIHLTEKDNPAAGIFIVGLLLGVAAIICGVFYGEGTEEPTLAIFLEEITEVAIYGGVGLVLLLLAGMINDKIVLRKFSNRKEIIEAENSAVAIVVAVTYVGSGLIIAGGICGSVNVLSMLVAVAIGQVALVLFAMLYQWATSYDDQKELGENQNVAAGLAFGGNLLAYSLVLMKGLSMDVYALDEWTRADKLLNVAYYALAGGLLLVATCWINDRLFFPKARMRKEIVEDRNVNAGLLEAGLAIAMGAAMVFCL